MWTSHNKVPSKKEFSKILSYLNFCSTQENSWRSCTCKLPNLVVKKDSETKIWCYKESGGELVSLKKF